MPLSAFTASLRAVKARFYSRSVSNAWARDIGDVVAGLESLNLSTEKDFLSVGGRLMEFLNSSRDVHSQLDGLVSMISGERTQQLCDELCSVRNRGEEVQQREQETAQALLTLQTAASLICRGFSSFGRISMSFHIAAILARIETATLSQSQQDLSNLAAEVGSCSDIIESRARQVLDAAKAFDTRISAILKEAASFEAIRTRDLPDLLAEVDRDLNVIQVRQRDASSASLQMQADMNSVVQHIGALITSLQFQDIIRQRLEHIIDALRDLLGGPGKEVLAASTPSVIELQKLQLDSAASSFSQSTSKIEADLEKIEKMIERMASVTNSILGDGDKDSFLPQLQGRLAAIVATVRQLHALQAAQGKAITDLESINGQLKDSVSEVQVIEVQLSRIAANAAVSACHLGAAGEPLNVVAGAIQTLQKECASRSREAEEAIVSINAAIARLALLQRGASFSTGTLQNLDAHAAILRETHEASMKASSTIAVLAKNLCGGVRQTRQHFTIGKIFAETVNGYIHTLVRLASEMRLARVFTESASGSLHDAHAQRYTMQSERDVHRASGEIALAPAECEEEVEFF